MCGINALIDFSGRLEDHSALVAKMNEQMVSRGPDGSGLLAEGPIALGMRRLSIIDLAGGDQPIFNENKSLVLICNGEIYNYIELTEGLKARGHQFSTGSDVECILHLYEEKGPSCLEDLRGMFSFVLWDRQKRVIFAARDRVGIKPLYISRYGGVIWLSSELKAIVKAAGFKPTLNLESVHEFLMFSYPIGQRHTPVEEVERVLPGEYLLIDTSGIAFHRYWSPAFGGTQGLQDRSDAEIFETLEQAIHLHLRSDVPVGILLSGGIDSSAIAALASRQPGHYSAICAGYTGHYAVDERASAEKTANDLGIDYIPIEIDPTQFGTDFQALTECCDEPIGDVAAMAQWAIYRRARDLGFKVLLSGIGGDEVFFGYPMWNRLGKSLTKLGVSRDRESALILEKMSNHLGRQVHDLTSGPLKGSGQDTGARFQEFTCNSSTAADGVASVLFGSYLVHNGCQLADKIGMGCSVEVRVPFLDHQLIEHVLALPLARRFSATVGKPLLRKLLRGYVSDRILDGKKKGFSPPTPFVDEIVMSHRAMLFDGTLAQHGWLDRTALDRTAKRLATFRWLKPSALRNRLWTGNSSWLLFRMIAFERWFEALNHLSQRG